MEKKMIGIEVLEEPKYQDPSEREILAENEDNLTPELIDRLTRDENYWVRSVIASHPNLTEEQMNRLSQDEDKCVRGIIAMRHDLTEEQITRLRQDQEEYVRIIIATNPHAKRKGMKL